MWMAGWNWSYGFVEGRLIGNKYFIRSYFIKRKFMLGLIGLLILNGCASLKESLLIGAGSGVVIGGAIGSQNSSDRTEDTIKGAVVGGVVMGLASYLIHNSLEKRDANVRRETLMNLEHFEVLGVDGLGASGSIDSRSGKCFTTREVDGRLVFIPCGFVSDPESGEGGK